MGFEQVIELTQGDELPRITVNLSDKSTGNPASVSSVSSATLKFRRVGSTTSTSIPCDIEPPYAIAWDWPPGTLDGTPGDYEGELTLMVGTQEHTVFTPILFTLRAQF